MILPETLESRRLFAVTASVTAGVLDIVGDANNNTIRVYRSGTDLVVKGYTTGPLVPLGELLRVAESAVWKINIWGHGGNDWINVGSTVTETLVAYGGTGADTIQAGGGPSTLWGHVVSSGGLSIIDDNAADLLIGGAGNDALNGQGGNDTLQTSPAALIPWMGTDVLNGGNGDDLLITSSKGMQADLYGGAGNDTFRPDYSARGLFTKFRGGSGVDMADYNSWPVGIYAFPDGIHYSGPLSGGESHVLGSDVEGVNGTNYRDEIVDGPADNIFYGRGGPDLMWRDWGSNSNATSIGNDTLYGGGGADELYGSYGDDALYGESGDDWISGDPGNDYLLGGSGADTMYGMTGDDVIDARDGIAGNDRLVGTYSSSYDVVTEPGANDIGYIDHQLVVVGSSLQIVTDDHEQFHELHWD